MIADVDERETIVAAAIDFEGVVYSVPRPGRHNDVIHKIVRERGVKSVPGSATQGFLTSGGQFVNRWRAHRIAVDSGQPCSRPLDLNSELYSEDVW